MMRNIEHQALTGARIQRKEMLIVAAIEDAAIRSRRAHWLRFGTVAGWCRKLLLEIGDQDRNRQRRLGFSDEGM